MSISVQTTVRITAVHLVGGTGHEHIAEVRWQRVQSGQSGNASREKMVAWLRESPSSHIAIVSDGYRDVRVGVVDANPPYLRTYADGRWTNNLLALPRY